MRRHEYMSNMSQRQSTSVFLTNAKMARLCVLVALFVTGCVAGRLSAPSHETILSVRSQVKTLVDNWPELGPKLVRLSFHDCVGGCDGCIDLTDGNNWGLEAPILSLAALVVEFQDRLSRADVWAAAGLVANEMAQQPGSSASRNFTFDRYGRQDCGPSPTGSPQPIRTLPSPDMATVGVMEYFKHVFDMTANETVAIMGAHTLGFASRNQSGFDGPGGWDSHPLVLDNKYFGNMLNHPWRQVFIDNAGLDTPDRWIWRLADVERVPPGRASATSRRLRMASVSNQEPSDASLQKPTSWEKQSTHALNDEPTPKEFQFMFNADLALVRDFEHALDASGFVACSVLPSADGAGKPAVCPDSTTANKVSQYSEDQATFLREYEAAFKKMIYTVPDGNAPLSEI